MADGDAAVLEVEGLDVALPRGADRPLAVAGLSLRVGRGEVVCLVGESGSGKSVTAQAIMGLLPPRDLRAVAGSIRLEGEELLRAGAARLRALRGARMAMVFQEPMTALNPVVACGRQIDEVFRAHTDLGRKARRERVLDAMARVRLPDPARLYDAFPHTVSGGQRQRVMIAMALALDPALLIADEPTTALDVTTQAEILRLLAELRERRGTGVLFITHDFGVVAEVAHRVAVMRAGRVVEEGPAEAVLRRPRDPYTRMLIAAVPGLAPRPPRRPAAAGPGAAPGAPPPVALRTEGLSKTYAEGGLLRPRRVVAGARDVALEVRRGEALGLVGESGSGKTTVARLVARLIEPSSGRIWLAGEDLAAARGRRLRALRRRVQIVFQDPYRSLNPRRTVGQSVAEGPLNYGMPRGRALARAAELLALVGLEPAALARFPHQFSGGQRQRICIARALALEPDLLVADEAVSALDVSVQAQILDLFDALRERFGLALLFITHDLRVAARLCDRVAVMRAGEVVESGEAALVLTAPRHPYTRELVAAAPGRAYPFGGVVVPPPAAAVPAAAGGGATGTEAIPA